MQMPALKQDGNVEAKDRKYFAQPVNTNLLER